MEFRKGGTSYYFKTEEVIAAFRNGDSIDEIAHAYNESREDVERLLREFMGWVAVENSYSDACARVDGGRRDLGIPVGDTVGDERARS